MPENTQHDVGNKMFGSRTIKQTIALYMVIGLTLLVVGGTSSWVLQTQRTEKLSTYLIDVEMRRSILINLLGNLGYSGGVHAFKNYVLRQDISYAQAAEKGFQKTVKEIKRYQSIADRTSLEQEALKQISVTVQKYIENIDVVKTLIGKSTPISDIDTQVRIDDSAAARGIQLVLADLRRREIIALKNLKTAETAFSIGYAIFYSLLVLAGLYAATNLGKRISQQLENLTFHTQLFAEGNLTRPIEYRVKPQDEFDVLAQNFEEMRERLLTKRKKLKESKDDLARLIKISSHDFRESLKKIYYYINAMDVQSIDRMGTQILESAERIESQIKDVETFSEYVSDSVSLESVDLNQVCHMAWLNIPNRPKQAKLNIDNLPLVYVNEKYMLTLFRHLFENSLKFHGKEPITISVTHEEIIGDRIIVAVSDNGPGVDDRFHSRIFELFSRLHSRTEFEGNGVGLAICRKIVESFNGLISAASNAAGGLVVSFDLPRTKT